jgi:hypothetical protein
LLNFSRLNSPDMNQCDILENVGYTSSQPHCYVRGHAQVDASRRQLFFMNSFFDFKQAELIQDVKALKAKCEF